MMIFRFCENAACTLVQALVLALSIPMMLASTNAYAQTQPGGVVCAVEGYIGEFDPMPGMSTHDLLTRGNIAFVVCEELSGGARELVAIDFSVPESPVVLDSIEVGTLDQLQIHGQTLYAVVVGETGLRSFDLSDPSSLSPGATIDLPHAISTYAIQGDRLAYYDSDHAARIVDISDPGSPIELAEIPVPMRTVSDLELIGDRLYLALNEAFLVVYDIEDLASPTPVATHPYDSSLGHSLFVKDGLLFLFTGSYRYDLFQLDPGGAELELLAETSLTDLAPGYTFVWKQDIELDGDVVTISTTQRGVMRFSIQDRQSPELLGYTGFPMSGSYNPIGTIDNGLTLVANCEKGISLIDMNQANTVYPHGERWNRYSDFFDTNIRSFILDDVGFSDQVLIEAYDYIDPKLSEIRYAIAFIDASNPESPVLVSSIPTGEALTTQIEVDGRIAFIGDDFESGLRVIDFSTPESPVQIFETSIFFHIDQMQLSHDTLWVLNDREDHFLIDVSDPSSPVIKGYYNYSTSAFRSAFEDDRLYMYATIAEDTEGIVVVDLTNPLQPVLTTHVTPAEFSRIEVHNGVLYALDDDLETLYASPVNDLDVYGSTRVPRFYRGIAYAEEFAYGFSEAGQVEVYDIRDPYSVSFYGALPIVTPIEFDAMPVYSEGGLVFLDEIGGVYANASTECASCPADLTGDGELDFFDVTAFLQAYMSLDPSVDFNDDGSLDFYDVSAFLQFYGQGCP